MALRVESHCAAFFSAVLLAGERFFMALLSGTGFFQARNWSGARRGMFGVKARFWGENFVVSNGAPLLR
jgi:hypothetical protein